MTFGRSKKWSDWRYHITTRCDALTRGLTPPIPLREIFSQCHVKKVIFQPLLLEAALAVDDDGFVVYVDCDKGSKEAYQLAFNGADQGRSLPVRFRFSLAHELIHTFFYDTKQHPYTNWLAGTHAKEIESLEQACNFGASHLLLPTKLLKSDARKVDVLTADGIIDLATRYQVSIECLINRLAHLEDWTSRRGLVVFARQEADGIRIKAVAKSVAVRELFKNVFVGAEFKTAFGQVLFEATQQQSGSPIALDLTFPKHGVVGVAKCRMEYRRVPSISQAFVLVLNVDDLTQPTAKHKHSNSAEHHIAKLRDTIKQPSMVSRIAQQFK
jgi:hypothetical protein